MKLYDENLHLSSRHRLRESDNGLKLNFIEFMMLAQHFPDRFNDSDISCGTLDSSGTSSVKITESPLFIIDSFDYYGHFDDLK